MVTLKLLLVAVYDILKHQINGKIKKNIRVIGKALCDFLLIYFSMIFLFHEKDNISIDKILGLDLFMMFDKAIRLKSSFIFLFLHIPKLYVNLFIKILTKQKSNEILYVFSQFI